MLVIRQTQIEEFARIDRNVFEEWMLQHVEKFFPERFRERGANAIRQTIRLGISRAASYGIRSKRDVCRFIDVMVVLGPGFDTDERFSWAQNILTGRANPTARVSALIEATRSRLNGR